MVVTEAMLKAGTKRQVEGDLACVKCSYSLVGLRIDDRCPECGTPVQSSVSRSYSKGDELTAAPAYYLRRFASACWAAAFSALGVTLLLLVAFFVGSVVAMLAAAVCAAVWFAAVWFVTAPRRSSVVQSSILDKELPRLRAANRSLAAAWCLGALLAALAIWMDAQSATAVLMGTPVPYTDGQINVVRIAAAVLFLVALAGLAPLAIQLAVLADWARDGALADRFRLAAWLICFGGPIVFLGPSLATIFTPLVLPFYLLAFFAWGAMLIGIIAFLAGIVQLAIVSGWAVRNAGERIAVDRRRAEREERERRSATSRMQRAGTGRVLPQPPPSVLPVDSTLPAPRELNAYELAPEEGEPGP